MPTPADVPAGRHRRMNHHLMIVCPRYVSLILSGHKTLECRLSITRLPPFRCVAPGDTLWLKASGGPVVATIRAVRIQHINPVTPAVLEAIAARYGPSIHAAPLFFARHRLARYGTIIQLGRVTPLVPFVIDKRDRRAWVVLRKPPRHAGVTVGLQPNGRPTRKS